MRGMEEKKENFKGKEKKIAKKGKRDSGKERKIDEGKATQILQSDEITESRVDEEENMDEDAMERIDWYGEDHWIKMALDFWEGPRRKGNTSFMDIDNKDKGMGKYLIDKAKELRDAGVPTTLKGRVELFALE